MTCAKKRKKEISCENCVRPECPEDCCHEFFISEEEGEYRIFESLDKEVCQNCYNKPSCLRDLIQYPSFSCPRRLDLTKTIEELQKELAQFP